MFAIHTLIFPSQAIAKKYLMVLTDATQSPHDNSCPGKAVMDGKVFLIYACLQHSPLLMLSLLYRLSFLHPIPPPFMHYLFLLLNPLLLSQQTYSIISFYHKVSHIHVHFPYGPRKRFCPALLNFRLPCFFGQK